MTRDDVARATADRLSHWARLLVQEHATPLITIGVAHDHKSGQIVVCVPEDVDTREMVAFLRHAIRLLEG